MSSTTDPARSAAAKRGWDTRRRIVVIGGKITLEQLIKENPLPISEIRIAVGTLKEVLEKLHEDDKPQCEILITMYSPLIDEDVKLPEEKFSGALSDWTKFHSEFDSGVGAISQIVPELKLQLLKNNCTGTASRYINKYNDYETAMKGLKEKYLGNRLDICIKEMVSIPTPGKTLKEIYEEILPFVECINERSKNNPLLVGFLLAFIPDERNINNDWKEYEKTVSPQKAPEKNRITLFLEFLEKKSNENEE